jgi:hypothetical protein
VSRVVFDEGVPRPLKRVLTGHDVRTAPEMGWAGLANGRLLAAAEGAGFDVMLTSDQNMQFQTNISGFRLAVIVIPTNRWGIVRNNIAVIERALAAAQAGTFSAVKFARRQPRAPRPEI